MLVTNAREPVTFSDNGKQVLPLMATLNDWVEGARLRTLPAAIAPVIVGTASAIHMGAVAPVRAVLALVVALALQIGANYSNDYSDGIRGTDDFRLGPARLTGGKLTAPKNVLIAALVCFGIAGVAGLALLALSGAWILLIPGILAVLATWFYTGGRTPYGYMGIGLSELFVFLFFGLMACVGTTWTQIPQAPGWLWMLASTLGFLSVALLMANNIRDIPTDRESGKRTLAVRLGDTTSRNIFTACFTLSVMSLAGLLSTLAYSWPLILVALIITGSMNAPAVLPIVRGETGARLIPVLRNTGLYTLAWAIEVSAFLLLA